MKVLLINGSPHAQGCTFTALSMVADELQKNGVETEIIHVGHKDIRGCIGCYKCRELGHCIFDKDMVNEVAKKFEEADGLVIGSPVYYAGPNGTLVSFLNRLFFSASFSKRFKVGAAVVSARRMGAEHEQMDIKVDGNHATLTGRSRVNAAVFGGGRHTWRLQLYFQLYRYNGHWLFTNAQASTY